MKREELTKRIEKKKNDIAKIERRIVKWETGMSDEVKNEMLTYLDKGYVQFNVFRNEHRNDARCYNSDWNKGPNLDEAYRAHFDLLEAKNTLAKYENALIELDNFERETKIEVIWNFLLSWKEDAREFYHNNAKLMFELNCTFEDDYKTFKKEHPDATYYELRQFESEYMSNIEPLTYDIVRIKYENRKVVESLDKPIVDVEDPSKSINGVWRYKRVPVFYEIDEKLLGETLDKEMKAKYKDLVKRITSKVGNIVDASNLHIGAKGTIDGIVVGDKGKVRIETVYAGGYNIQCLHCRVLVHEIKK